MEVYEYVIVKKSVGANSDEEELSLLDGKVHLCLARDPVGVLKHAEKEVLAKQVFKEGETVSVSLRPFQRESALVRGNRIAGGFPRALSN